MVNPEPVTQPGRFMIGPFPQPGYRVRQAYTALDRAASNEKQAALELSVPPHELPRPWDPASCRSPELRQEVWEWLEAVVIWLNHEYVWDIATMIPACWPAHPHLVHEIAVLADQRRAAGLALNSIPMEEWHRYSLPMFIDRIRTRVRDHCEEDHQAWPARSRHTRHLSNEATKTRHQIFNADLNAITNEDLLDTDATPQRTRLVSVNLDTGEATDLEDL